MIASKLSQNMTPQHMLFWIYVLCYGTVFSITPKNYFWVLVRFLSINVSTRQQGVSKDALCSSKMITILQLGYIWVTNACVYIAR